MALIIRKVKKYYGGDNVLRDEDALGQISTNNKKKSVLNGENAIGQNYTPVEERPHSVQNGAGNVVEVTTPPPPAIDPNKKARLFINGVEVTNFDLNWINNQYQYASNRFHENTMLDRSEASAANHQISKILTDALNNKKTVKITNGELMVDDDIVIGEADYKRGWDNALKKNHVPSYMVGYWGGWKNSEDSQGFGTFQSYTPRIVLISKSPAEQEEEVEKSEIEKFNERYQTTGDPYTDDLLRPKGLYRFDKGNGNYIFAKKDANGAYVLDETPYDDLIYTAYGSDNFGGVYTGINGIYRLINRDSVGNENSNYQNKFGSIYNPKESSVILDLKARSDKHFDDNYYNEHTTGLENPLNIVDMFNGNSQATALYIDTKGIPTTHFGFYDFDKVKEGKIVVSENGEDVTKDVTFRKEGAFYYAKEKGENGKDYFLGGMLAPKSLNLGYKDPYYQEIIYEPFGVDIKDILEEEYFPDSNVYAYNDNDQRAKILSKEENYEYIIQALNTFSNQMKSSEIFKDEDKQKIFNGFNNLILEFITKYPNKSKKLRYELSKIYKQIVPPLNKFGGSIKRLETGGLMLYLNSIDNTPQPNVSDSKEPSGYKRAQNIVGKESATFDTEWSGTDYARASAVGLNAASLAGGWVGVGAGLAATAVEATADIIDYQNGKISGSELAKNIAMNLGFTVLAFIPGAASAKIAKGVVKGGAKAAKALSKLKSATEGADKVSDIVKNVDEVLNIKDAKNILNAADELIKKGGLIGEEAKKAQEVIDICQTVIKAEGRKVIPEVIAKTTQGAFALTGLTGGVYSGFNMAGKALRGDADEISLSDIQGLVGGVAGYKGAKGLFKQYALNKALVDTNDPVLSTNSEKVPLRFGNKEIQISSKNKDPKSVKQALNDEIRKLRAEKKNSKTTQERKAEIEEQLNTYKEFEKNFDDIYGRGSLAKNWVSKKADDTKDLFSGMLKWVKTPDYSNKKITSEDGWVINKGKKYAKELGFTEDGSIDWNKLNNIFNNKHPITNWRAWEKPPIWNPINLLNRSYRSIYSGLKNLKIKRGFIGSLNQENANKFAAANKYLDELNEIAPYLKKLNLITDENINEFKSLLGGNATLINKLNSIFNLPGTFKKGGNLKKKVKKYTKGDLIDDASSSAGGGTDAGGTGGFQTVDFSMFNTNFNNLPEAPQIPKRTWTFDPESAINSAYFANQFAGTFNAYKPLRNIETSYKEAPYLHSPIKRNLAAELNFLNQINQGRLLNSLNQTSDNLANMMQSANLQSSIFDNLNKFNVYQIEDFNTQRDKQFAQEYTNETLRINTANHNIELAVDLTNKKRELNAAEIKDLTTIAGNALLKFSGLINDRINASKYADLLKNKADITLRYQDSINPANDWIEKQGVYGNSTYKNLATALGIGDNEVITQEHVNKYIADAAAANQNISVSDQEWLKKQIGMTTKELWQNEVDRANRFIDTQGTLFGKRNTELESDYYRNQHYLTYTPRRSKKGGTLKKYEIDKKYDAAYKKLLLEYQKQMLAFYKETSKNLKDFFKK